MKWDKEIQILDASSASTQKETDIRAEQQQRLSKQLQYIEVGGKQMDFGILNSYCSICDTEFINFHIIHTEIPDHLTIAL